MNYSTLFEYFTSVSSGEKFIKFTKKIISTKLKIIGVKVPVIKKIAKEIAKTDSDIIFIYPLNQYYEINFTFLLVLAYKKQPIKEKLESLFKYLKYLDNWAICDCVVSVLKVDESSKDYVFNWIIKCLDTNKEFIVRFGLIMLLKFFVNKEYIYKIFDLLKNLNYDYYYISMGVAWLLSVCYIEFSDEVENFLFTDRFLPNKVVNMTVQKCLDSYRIEKDKKLHLKKLKKLYLNQQV